MNANRLLRESSVVSFKIRVDRLNTKIGQMPLNAGYHPLRDAFNELDNAKAELLVAGLLRGVSTDD